ncbi:18656_t:CDS:2 [Gigaspora rosea]|nr:18656_t:CDS:2 [Gigaspora rosea]
MVESSGMETHSTKQIMIQRGRKPRWYEKIKKNIKDWIEVNKDKINKERIGKVTLVEKESIKMIHWIRVDESNKIKKYQGCEYKNVEKRKQCLIKIKREREVRVMIDSKKEIRDYMENILERRDIPKQTNSRKIIGMANTIRKQDITNYTVEVEIKNKIRNFRVTMDVMFKIKEIKQEMIIKPETWQQ